MGNIIYWKQYDEPRKYYDQIFEKDREVTGEYFCTDERVERFWVFGCSSIDPSKTGIQMKSTMILKGKEERWESEPIEVCLDPDNAQETIDNLISQAEQYLQSLSISKCIEDEFPDHDYQKIIPE